MKKFLIITLLFAGALQVNAQNAKSQEMLTQLAAKIKAMGNYHAGFEVEADGNLRKGVYAVSGDKFYMKTDDYEVISDGKARYDINHYDEEVLIDKADPNNRDILSNPTKAFEFATDTFKSSYKGEKTIEGVVHDVVELVPVDTKSPLQRITIVINRKTGLPVELRYMSEGLSSEVVVAIRKIETGSFPGATFTFDRTKYRDYDVVDFR